jgi:hypothetical protein
MLVELVTKDMTLTLNLTSAPLRTPDFSRKRSRVLPGCSASRACAESQELSR